MSDTARTTPTLDDRNYRRLLREADTERQEAVVRLAGETGLRPTEMTRLALADVEHRRENGVEHALLRVDEGESERLAWLPGDLEAILRAYASKVGCSESEPPFDVSPRRIQMIVSEVTDRAAAAHDDPSLGSVSTRDLRRYHARTLLERGVNPLVVGEVTAWNRLETLASSLPRPDEETVLAAIGAAAGPEDDGPGDVAARDAAPGRNGASASRDEACRYAELLDRAVQLGGRLSGASTQEAIEREGCDTLAASYEYAWIAGETGNGRLGIRALATDGRDDESTLPTEPPGTACREVFEAGEPAVVSGSGTVLPVSGEPATRAIVPVEHAGTTYGVLEVGVAADPDGMADRERRTLADFGRRLGQSIAAVKHRRLLLADTVVRLAFRCTDERAVFVRLSDSLDCSFTLTGLVPGEDGSLLTFAWLEGASPDDVFGWATETASIASARLIRSGDDGALLEFVLTEDSPVITLVERGGSVTDLTASGGTGTFTAEFVPDVNVREVVEALKRAFPDSEMVSKREVERSVGTDSEFQQALEDTLTDKQRSALQAAYLSGYFDWPRGSTAEELAESLGVSSPTFHNHLRRAQRKVLSRFLGDGEP